VFESCRTTITTELITEEAQTGSQWGKDFRLDYVTELIEVPARKNAPKLHSNDRDTRVNLGMSSDEGSSAYEGSSGLRQKNIYGLDMVAK